MPHSQYKKKHSAPSDKDLFIFVHIPKTAGMTFRKILDRQFAASQIQKIGPDFQASIDQIKNLAAAEKARISCVSGHVPYGIHHSFSGRNVYYLSFVRNPVDRAVSEYFYFKKRPELLPMIGLDQSCTLTPQIYLQHIATTGMGNFQTRILSGYGDMINGGVLPPYKPIPETTETDLLDTIQKKISFIGSVALFDESLLLMQEKFGWRSIRYISRNVAKSDPAKQELRQTLSDEIQRLNPFDTALYHSTIYSIKNDLTNRGEEFQQKLRRYRFANRFYSWAWEVYRKSGMRKLRLAMRKS